MYAFKSLNGKRTKFRLQFFKSESTTATTTTLAIWQLFLLLVLRESNKHPVNKGQPRHLYLFTFMSVPTCARDKRAMCALLNSRKHKVNKKETKSVRAASFVYFRVLWSKHVPNYSRCLYRVCSSKWIENEAAGGIMVASKHFRTKDVLGSLAKQ